MKRTKTDPILLAIDEDAYTWMQEQSPRYISAITEALEGLPQASRQCKANVFFFAHRTGAHK